jgi:hypothetical protein
MRIVKKFGRSSKVVVGKRRTRLALKDAAKTAIEKLEERRLLSTVFQNFNAGSTSFTGNFNVTNAGSFTFGASGGLLDEGTATAGGAVLSTTVDSSAVYDGGSTSNPGATPLADGNVHILSAMVKDSDAGTGDKPLQLGWLGGATQAFNATAPDSFISARLLGFTQLNLQTGNNGATGSVATPTFTGAASGDWLQLTVTAQETNTATGTFTFGYTITDYGPSGNSTTPAVLLTGSNTEASAGLANVNGYPGFRCATIVGQAIDNFSADPATTAPSAPVVTATPGNNFVALSWPAVSGATTYNILRSTSTGTETLLAENACQRQHHKPRVHLRRGYRDAVHGDAPDANHRSYGRGWQRHGHAQLDVEQHG